jgi:hypothetical protein
MISTRRLFVNVVLCDTCRNHRKTTQRKTSRDLLDRTEVDLEVPQQWIDAEIHDRNHYDDEDGVQLRNDIVGYMAEIHCIRLRNQVSCHLVVREPVERVPEKHLAGEDATPDFIYPFVVERHPSGDSFATGAHHAGLEFMPKVWISHVLLERGWIPGTPAFEGETDELPCFAHNGASWWRELVIFLKVEENGWTEEVADCWQGVREPKADIVLRIDHGQRTGERTTVDQKIEVDVDACRGYSRVDNLSMAALVGTNISPLVLVLFGNDDGDVGFEATCS